jgi:hypothetical protein
MTKFPREVLENIATFLAEDAFEDRPEWKIKLIKTILDYNKKIDRDKNELTRLIYDWIDWESDPAKIKRQRIDLFFKLIEAETTEDGFRAFLKEKTHIRPRKVARLNKSAIQKVDPIFERSDIENILRLPFIDWGKPTITRYPDQGTFTAVYERQTSKTQTIYARFPEIPIEYEGKVPYLGKMLFHVLVSTFQIAMHERSFSIAFPKSEQLELMDMKAQGTEFEMLTNCHRTWYYLDVGVKDKTRPNWEYHKRVYSDFETLPGKGGFISVKLNASAWSLLGKFFENPQKLKGQFYKIGRELGSVKNTRQQTLFELSLSQYAGLGNRIYPHSLKKIFDWIEIHFPEYSKRGMPWAVKELEKCLKCSLEKNQIIGWTYEPSEETIKILESDPHIRGFCRREDVEKNGPAWLSDRLKQIHKEFGKVLKAKKRELPRKLDPFDVYMRWKIKILLGDKRQRTLLEQEQKKQKDPKQILYDLSRQMGR